MCKIIKPAIQNKSHSESLLKVYFLIWLNRRCISLCESLLFKNNICTSVFFLLLSLSSHLFGRNYKWLLASPNKDRFFLFISAVLLLDLQQYQKRLKKMHKSVQDWLSLGRRSEWKVQRLGEGLSWKEGGLVF